jgi:hypothetical protein
MMFGSGHLISGLDVATGTFVLMIFSAGAALAVLIVLALFTLRRAGQSAVAGVWWMAGLAVAGSMFAYALFDRFATREQAAERRAIEERTAELTARSLAPGSALGCLDAVASIVVENACERPLFASPEAVAAAVGYVNARFSLLVASATLAEHDPSYQPPLERLRRGLEADRYGLVAHVLTTRGCNGAECPELRLLRDPSRVLANMKSRAFESFLGTHALAWQQSGSNPGPAVAAMPPSLIVPPPAPAPLSTTGTGTPAAPAPGAGSPSKFDFPSSSSIPAISIMTPEPGAPPAAEPRSAPSPSRRGTASSRRQSAREAAPAPTGPTPAPTLLPPPPPPTQIAPETEPAETAGRGGPDLHSTR